jgi:hypothetical protein
MTPTAGALIAVTLILINFSLGMAILYRTIKKG